MNEETTTILIDTALAAGTATTLDPEDRGLQELVLAIRDDAPVPAADFELRMNARVAAGFPPRRSGRFGRLRVLATTRPQLAALGAAASLLVAIVIAVAIGSGSSQRAPVAPTSASSGASTGAAAAAKAAPQREAAQSAPDTAAAPAVTATGGGSVIQPEPPVTNGFVGGSNRKVERSAQLVLAPPKDKLNDVGDEVIAVTDRYRGIVMSSSVTQSADQSGGGNFDLRIPVRNLQPALRDLSALADVQSRTENADDVTASFVNARTRLQELQAERRGLLRRLANASTDRQAAGIRTRLRFVNSEIQGQLSALTDLKRRTSYAQVSVTLAPKDSGAVGGIGSGARDLRDSLVDAVNIALRVLGVALPIGLVIALVWAFGGWFTRRRREAVLG